MILSDTYALIVLDLHESCWGTISGTNISVLGNMDSIVPSKHSQGGQSSKRFERLRDIAINEFFVKLGDRISTSLMPLNENLKGILIGGCGLTKDEFMNGEYLHHELRKKLIGSFDVGYTNEHGLYELAEASKEKLIGLQSTHEKEIFDGFLKQLAKNINKCAYGLINVFDTAKTGKIKQVIVSSNQHETISKIMPLSNEKNFEIIVISECSESGKILNQAFGGIVAMLRYE